MASDMITIGEILRYQGNKGEVRVRPLSNIEGRFEYLTELYLVKNKISKKVNIEDIWYHKQFVILKFEGFDDIETAIDHKGYLLQIPEDERLELDDDSYYCDDIIGLDVYTNEGEYLGILSEVLETGANDVYTVKNGEEELLLPATKEVILNVDLKNFKMEVKLIPGLR